MTDIIKTDQNVARAPRNSEYDYPNPLLKLSFNHLLISAFWDACAVQCPKIIEGTLPCLISCPISEIVLSVLAFIQSTFLIVEPLLCNSLTFHDFLFVVNWSELVSLLPFVHTLV